MSARLVILTLLAATALPGCGKRELTTEQQVIDVLEQPRNDEEQAKLIDTGRRLFAHYNCQTCHQLNGPSNSAPNLRNLYVTQVELEDGSRLQRDRAYLARSILRSREQVVPGYPQAMSNYRFLSPEKTAALVAYLEDLSPPAPRQPDAPPDPPAATQSDDAQ